METAGGARQETRRRLASEAVGTAFLLMAVVGSGIMGDRLSAGNAGLALLANSLATGAALVALILAFGPVSGAHINPAVSLSFALRKEMSWGETTSYVGAQLAGALVGVIAANAMFDEPLLAAATTARHGSGQWLGEGIATFGLVAVIGAARPQGLRAVAATVGCYIGAAYWFTSSTSFANPAVTLARAMTNTFSGIAPGDVLPFLLAQTAGALLAASFVGWMSKAGDSP